MGPGCRVSLTPALCAPTAGGPGEECGDAVIIRAMTDGGVIDREPYATGCFPDGAPNCFTELGDDSICRGTLVGYLGAR